MDEHLEYLPELGSISEFMRTQPLLNEALPFPYGYGEITSRLVEKIIPELAHIKGFVNLGQPKLIEHHWNYDRQKKLYIDLTMQQYGKGQPEILISKPNQGIFHENTEKPTMQIYTTMQDLESKLSTLERSYKSYRKKLAQTA